MSKSCRSLDALLQITALSSPSVQHLELERKGIASDLGQAGHEGTGSENLITDQLLCVIKSDKKRGTRILTQGSNSRLHFSVIFMVTDYFIYQQI